MNIKAAPKDPEKQRPFFYIVHNKEIYASAEARAADSSKPGAAVHAAQSSDNLVGVTYLYESDGRLESSAKLTGGVTDPDMINMLSDAGQFRKLVHSMGVTIETQDPTMTAGFVFQVYGKTDRYGGGTCFEVNVPCDGMEQKIKLEDFPAREDDDVMGQIQVHFPKPDMIANLTVKLYLNDGYTAPVVEEDEAVDTSSEAYGDMIENSLMQLGNCRRLQNVIRKAQSGEDITIGFIGGSITQGAGATPINTECYAYKTYQKFCKEYGNDRGNIHFRKAGVGGTPSELGMIRFQRDLVRGSKCPDLVIVEFAVNDEGDETKGDCYESLVRQILMQEEAPAVILLFAVFADDWNLQDRLSCVGEHYDLPMVSVLDAVSPQFVLPKGAGRVISKNQYFYDMFHPTNLGHTVMADCLMNCIREAGRTRESRVEEIAERMIAEEHLQEYLKQTPAIGKSFENVRLFDRSTPDENIEIHEGRFTGHTNDLEWVEMDEDLDKTPQFPYHWTFVPSDDGINVPSAGDDFVMTLTCRSLVLVYQDSGNVNVGAADVYADDVKAITADPHINNWEHTNTAVVFMNQDRKSRQIRIRMHQEDLGREFTILGFGIVD